MFAMMLSWQTILLLRHYLFKGHCIFIVQFQSWVPERFCWAFLRCFFRFFFVLTLTPNGGLNQIAFCFLFCLLFLTFLFAEWQFKVCRQPNFSRDFWYISFDLLNMVSLDDQVKILFSIDVGNFLRTIGERFESFWVFIINFAIRFVVWLIIQIIQIGWNVQVIDSFHVALNNYI